MKNEFYVTVNSLDSLLYYPTNTGHNFRIHLRKQLNLPGKWSVSLSEFQYVKTDKLTGKNFWVMSNLCDESIVGDISIPLLRRIPIKKAKNGVGINHAVINEHFIPIVHDNVDVIHIYIKGDDNRVLSLIETDITCTLHFKLVSPVWFA
jgi:hypothetical protein